jgi:hypothetical protein
MSCRLFSHPSVTGSCVRQFGNHQWRATITATVPIALVGLALLGAGAGALLTARRRRA